METQSKDSDLTSIASRLRDAGFDADVRGTGKAIFIYARSPFGAVEISPDLGSYFLEYWNPIGEQSEKEESVRGGLAAFERAKGWLTGPIG